VPVYPGALCHRVFTAFSCHRLFEALTTIGFALQASDAFEWEDDIISEVPSDWSAPEVNFELNAETLNMHRDWLLGFGEPPVRNSVDPLNRIQGRLISVRIKTTY
jgi:hypothetical protein